MENLSTLAAAIALQTAPTFQKIERGFSARGANVFTRANRTDRHEESMTREASALRERGSGLLTLRLARPIVR